MSLFQIEQDLNRLCVMQKNLGEFLIKTIDLLQGDTPRPEPEYPPLPPGVIDRIRTTIAFLERQSEINTAYVAELEELIGWSEDQAQAPVPEPIRNNPPPRPYRPHSYETDPF